MLCVPDLGFFTSDLLKGQQLPFSLRPFSGCYTQGCYLSTNFAQVDIIPTYVWDWKGVRPLVAR